MKPDDPQPPPLAQQIASLRGQHAGRAGTGAAKRRGDAAYYKALAAKRKNPGRPKGS